jgi:hypothetical protein
VFHYYVPKCHRRHFMLVPFPSNSRFQIRDAHSRMYYTGPLRDRHMIRTPLRGGLILHFSLANPVTCPIIFVTFLSVIVLSASICRFASNSQRVKSCKSRQYRKCSHGLCDIFILNDNYPFDKKTY